MKNCNNTTDQTTHDGDSNRHEKACTIPRSTPCQLICIPNNELSTTTGFFQYLASHTQFWKLGFDHINRLGVIRLLAVSMVPTLAVIDNKSGKMITNWGMEAIEYNQNLHPEIVVESWRQGKHSVPTFARVTSACVIT